MNFKRTTLIFLIVILISSFICISTFAEPITGTCGESTVNYELSDDNVLTVSGTGAMPDYTDTERPWDEHASTIVSLVINDGVTEIGPYSFINICANAVIADSVTSIGEYALGYTYDGTEYTKIPNYSITAASGSAAHDYAIANGFEFISTTPPPPEIKEGKCGESISYTLTFDGILTISGSGDIYDYSSYSVPWEEFKSGDGEYVIRTVIIGEGVTNIGDMTFKDCTSLESVTMSSVESIGNEAFSGCTSLSSVTLSDTLEKIGNKSFSSCTSLVSITLPSTITTIGERAFEYAGLRTSTLPASLTSIGKEIFYSCEQLTKTNIYSTAVPTRTYSGCTALTQVTMHDGVTAIEESAFENCTSLVTVTVPDSLITVGPYAFNGCTALNNIKFSESVTSFGYYAFKNCSSLTSFSFSDTIQVIPEGMFYGCSSLFDVTLGDGINTIESFAFVNCKSLDHLFISYKVREFGQYCFGYAEADSEYIKITDISLEIEGFTPSSAKQYAEENQITFVHYKTVDTDIGNLTEDIIWKFRPSTGVLNIIGTGNMPDFLSFDETPWQIYEDYITHVTFSSGILNIGAYSFEGCFAVKSIDIPGSVQVIGAYAFAGTSVVTVNIPDGVTVIDNSSFDGCASLYTVTLPNTLTTIGEAAFRGPNIMTTVFIPQNVAYIGAYAIGYNSNNSVVQDFVIKGIDGSIANTYADLNGVSFIINGYVEIKDKNTGCSISMPGDTSFGYELSFSKNNSPLKPQLLIPSDATMLVYDISLTLNGDESSIGGSSELSFPIPDGLENKTLYIYSIDSNGNYVSVNHETKDGRIVFTCTSLGKFVVSNVDLSTTYTITVNHIYKDGSQASQSITVLAVTGAQYRFTAESIDNCTVDEYSYAGVVDGEDIVINFTYSLDEIPVTTEKTSPKTNKGDTKVVLIIILVVLIVALIAAVLLLYYLNEKKKKISKETSRTMAAAAKKPLKPDALAETIVVPDFATKEIDIESLFADEPEEDLIAEEELRKKIDSLKNDKK